MDKSKLFAALGAQHIETPSWGYANSGTRFGTFAVPSAARTLDEKLEDAATVHRLTGVCPTVALHIPWDMCDDWSAAARRAGDLGIRIGAINPNVFQDQCFKLGSVCNPNAAIRQKAIDAHLRCIEIAVLTGSKDISCWYADGTNFPGQDDFRARRRRLYDAFGKIYAALPVSKRLLIEYKVFEPAFYHTDLSDWGQSALLCRHLGERATVLVDTGHHAPGVNIEHIVATLLDEKLLGGFHFNGRKYADDDLTVGAINPYEMFLIYNELVGASVDADAAVRTCAANVAYMFDQCASGKVPLEATVQSVMFVQETYAKALMVDRAALAKAQASGDMLCAEEVMKDAFNTDVRPLLAEWRQTKGLAASPLEALRRENIVAKRAEERTKRHGAHKAAGGFQ